MNHLDEETLQRALHDELDGGVERRVRDHLATCVECSDRLERAEREERRVDALLEAVDHEVPVLDPDSLAEEDPESTPWRPLVAASVVLLIATAVLAYAVPGSPLRSWVRAAFLDEGPRTVSTTATEEGTASAAVAVEPGDSLEVVFLSSQERGAIHVSVGASEQVRLEIRGEAPDIRVEPHRLVVANVDATASYRLEIPEFAMLVRVRVEDHVVLEKRGSHISPPVTPPENGIEIPLR